MPAIALKGFFLEKEARQMVVTEHVRVEPAMSGSANRRSHAAGSSPSYLGHSPTRLIAAPVRFWTMSL
jgi:hypothetical protein